ncbi:MAG: transposase [Kofleriaceae bacterium]|nr:transposase [Kofleriaceae bacterium]
MQGTRTTGTLRTERRAARRRVARSVHEQLGLLNAAGTEPISRRGGKRPGAGRPPKGDRAGAAHKRRVAFSASQPLHIVLRVEKAVIDAAGGLRKRAIYQAIREATLVVARPEHSEQFRIVHVSIQRTHVHLVVEAQNKGALARGMQSFQISAAKHINAALSRGKSLRRRRRGRVFCDRYHSEVVSSPRHARHVLSYVLNNWRKHREDRDRHSRGWLVDPFSSGWSFSGWRQLEGRLTLWNVPESYVPMFVWLPRTWLLSTGWRRHGLIDAREVPRSTEQRRRLGSR